MIEFNVIDIKPLSVYDGNVYTQRIVGELNDGSRIFIEDPGCDIDDSTGDPKISAYVTGQTINEIISNSDQKSSIISTEGGNVDISGQIVALDFEESHPIKIKVNDSIVKLDADGIDGFEVGDWVTVPGVTLYLESIENR